MPRDAVVERDVGLDEAFERGLWAMVEHEAVDVHALMARASPAPAVPSATLRALARTAADHDLALPERVAAVHALGTPGSADAAPALARALESHDVELRRAAVVALAMISHVADVSTALDAAALDEDHEVRCGALAGLLAVGGPWAVSAAIAATNDQDPAVRRAAVVVLRRHGGAGAHDLLVAMTDDADVGVRRAARAALVERAA